ASIHSPFTSRRGLRFRNSVRALDRAGGWAIACGAGTAFMMDLRGIAGAPLDETNAPAAAIQAPEGEFQFTEDRASCLRRAAVRCARESLTARTSASQPKQPARCARASRRN